MFKASLKVQIKSRLSRGQIEGGNAKFVLVHIPGDPEENGKGKKLAGKIFGTKIAPLHRLIHPPFPTHPLHLLSSPTFKSAGMRQEWWSTRDFLLQLASLCTFRMKDFILHFVFFCFHWLNTAIWLPFTHNQRILHKDNMTRFKIKIMKCSLSPRRCSSLNWLPLALNSKRTYFFGWQTSALYVLQCAKKLSDTYV